MAASCSRSRFSPPALRGLLAISCAALLTLAEGVVPAQQTQVDQTQKSAPEAPAGAPVHTSPKIPPEQLDSLLAPIALYPDPLLAQTLVASTYPLEIIQLHQWLAKHKDLKDKALVDAVAKQPWDPSVQSMAAVPEVVKRLADDIQWTTELGNAFLAQQSDVMDAVQRMRGKAKDKGALKSNEQQKVETKTVEGKTVIVVESTDPEVVYVPSYSPVVVYGAPVYPYPPIYYPYYPPGAAFVSFSFGVMIGASWGGYCCGSSWGGNDIDINVDNNFNKIEHQGDRGDRGGNRGGEGGGKWQHNPEHRGGAPYADKSTADKYGGTARGDSARNREASARQQSAQKDRGAAGRASGAAPSDRSAGGSGSRGSGSKWSGPSSSGGDRIGNRNVPSSSKGSRSGGFGGGSGGFSGSSARASGARGASSMGGRGGGGRRR